MGRNSNNETTIIDIYGNKQVALSNALIQAREKTSLLESKIELLAIYKMKDEMKTVVKKDSRGQSYSVHSIQINSQEIRHLIGRKGGSLYGQIEAAALELKQKLYIYREPEKGQFKMDSLYGEVSYKGGKLNIEFNPSTEHLFMELKDNFTKIRLDIAFQFQTNGGFQLYKLLKSYAYTLPPVNLEAEQAEQAYIIKEYSLSELRLQLGYVDLNQPELKKEGAKAHPDAEKMTAMEKKPKYKRWADFYTRVLEPGIEEVNRISDIYISSIDKQLGEHGRVEGVQIVLQHNLKYYTKANEAGEFEKAIKLPDDVEIPQTEDEIFEFIDDLRQILKGLDLKTKDYKAIAEAALYNKDKIKKAYEVMNKSGEIDNVVGFLIKAIQNNYDIPVKAGSANKKGGFNDFDQREYDYEELENDVVNEF